MVERFPDTTQIPFRGVIGDSTPADNSSLLVGESQAQSSPASGAHNSDVIAQLLRTGRPFDDGTEGCWRAQLEWGRQTLSETTQTPYRDIAAARAIIEHSPFEDEIEHAEAILADAIRKMDRLHRNMTGQRLRPLAPTVFLSLAVGVLVACFLVVLVEVFLK